MWCRGRAGFPPASSPLPTLATCPGSSLKPLSLSSLACTLPSNQYTAPLCAQRGDVGPSEGARFPVIVSTCPVGSREASRVRRPPQGAFVNPPPAGGGGCPPGHRAEFQSPHTHCPCAVNNLYNCTGSSARLRGALSEHTITLRDGRFSQGTGMPPGPGCDIFVCVGLEVVVLLPVVPTLSSLPPQQSLASGCCGPSSVQGLRVGHASRVLRASVHQALSVILTSCPQ